MKRRKTEELEATQMLERVETLVSTPRPKLHPSYWSLNCAADHALPTEYPELEAASLTFCQELIKGCSHSANSGRGGDGNDCNLSYLRDSEVLSVRRVENQSQWEVYSAKKRNLVRPLQEAQARGGT
eukprot:739473-Rhodomonas_salina.1